MWLERVAEWAWLGLLPNLATAMSENKVPEIENPVMRKRNSHGIKRNVLSAQQAVCHHRRYSRNRQGDCRPFPRRRRSSHGCLSLSSDNRCNRSSARRNHVQPRGCHRRGHLAHNIQGSGKRAPPGGWSRHFLKTCSTSNTSVMSESKKCDHSRTLISSSIALASPKRSC